MSKKNEHTKYISTTPIENDYFESQLAEHNTAIELIKQELRQEFLHMKESIDLLTTQFNDFRKELMNQYTTKEQHESLKKDVNDLLSLKNWALRLVVGAIIVSLMAVIGIRQ